MEPRHQIRTAWVEGGGDYHYAARVPHAESTPSGTEVTGRRSWHGLMQVVTWHAVQQAILVTRRDLQQQGLR